MMAVYSLLLLAILVMGAPYWLLRMATSGRYRAGLAGRMGLVPKELRTAAAGQKVIWVHAVSVGEVMAAAQLIRELKAMLPEWVVAVSTTTEAGQRLARERMAGCPVFYLPLDFRFVVRRYLNALQPKMLVLMESELWPRLIDECAKADVPVAVANARISDRSLPRYLKLRRLWQPLLAQVSIFMAQSVESAERLVRIGAPAERVVMTGNLKYDVRVSRENELTELLRTCLSPDARVVVCGSTLEGEEKMLLEAWPAVVATEPGTVMVLAPRRPERFDAVEGMVRARGIPVMRASRFRERPETVTPGSVFLLDTIGDLAAIYSLGEAAFVGGSLVAAGGHNPLEPAQFGVPVMMGPSFENFREIVAAMQAQDAIRIVSTLTFGAALIDILRKSDEARAMGQRGRLVFAAQAGATRRTTMALMELLEERAVGER
jgi:3-deoxy-D-manno-octulosonic-acid transferase